MQPASEHTYEADGRSEHASERRCIVRGESGDKDLLIRFAISPDGVVVPDITEKLPGRGIWVSADATCISEAITKKMFGRAAKQPATAPTTLLDQTRTLLGQRVTSLLGLAKKAGDLAVGADAVLDGLKTKSLAAVAVAADASASGADDMRQRTSLPVIQTCLTAADLGAAIGRDNAVYLGLPRTKLGNSLMRDFLRHNGLYSSIKDVA